MSAPIAPPPAGPPTIPPTRPPARPPYADPGLTYWAPPATDDAPLPPSEPTPTASRPTRSGGRGRFAVGLLVGAAVGGAALGGYAIGTDASSNASPTVAADVVADPVSVDLGTGSTIAELVTAVRPSIVSVHQEVTQNTPFGSQTGTAAGTGWVLSADGYIVTNAHVVSEGDNPVVTFDDGSTEPATIVAADASRDLAVLHVERTDLTPLPIGDSDDLQLGDPLIAIGYALDLNGEPSVTSGILSAKERSITTETGTQLVDLLQTDAAINPGNSGGPLLNSDGEVIGINTAVAGEAQNIGFAIAISPVMDIIESLQGGTVPERALMGVSTTPPTAGGEGAEIVEISPGSGAATSQLEIGDVIVDVDGTSIDDPADLGTVIASGSPGDEVTVTVERDGQTVEVTVVLGARQD